MSNAPDNAVLIFGATGHTGAHTVAYALKTFGQVYVFVRNPDKLSSVVRAQVHLMVGDLTDPAAVAAAVSKASPRAIIICSGHPPKDAVTPLNAIAVRAIVGALSQAGQLRACFVVYLSGLFCDTPDDPLPWYAKWVRGIIVPMSGFQASFQDNLAVTRYLTAGEAGDLQFTIVRMGYPVEAASKGTIIPVAHNPMGAVTFDDMGRFLVKLADGEHRAEALGKAIKASYAKHR